MRVLCKKVSDKIGYIFRFIREKLSMEEHLFIVKTYLYQKKEYFTATPRSCHLYFGKHLIPIIFFFFVINIESFRRKSFGDWANLLETAVNSQLRSSYLTLQNYFLWAYLKTRVHDYANNFTQLSSFEFTIFKQLEKSDRKSAKILSQILSKVC